jgi:hypothetical protein
MMQPDRTLARTAGLLYLAMIVGTGWFYGFTMTIVTPGADTALAKLQASVGSLQIAILAGVFGLVAFTLLGVWLYRLFRPVDEGVALTLLVLVSVHAVISFVAVARMMDALALVRNPNLAGANLAGQVLWAVTGFNRLWLLSFVFSGLWLIPLGWLVYRCGFLPRIVGMTLMLGSVFYVMAFAGWVVDPAYEETLIGRIIGFGSGFPAVLGELGACISLLVVGFRRTAA